MSNVVVVVLSLTILVVVVANVVLWSYEMNQLDWERMQEGVSILGVTRSVASSWFPVQGEYTVNIGSRVSGTYEDTQAVDGSYETFREETETSSYNTRAFISYRSTSGSGTSYPKYRDYDGDSWDELESELASTGSPIRHVRVAYCPKSDRYKEKIVVALSDDGYLDAYVWDGTVWTTYSDVGRVWLSAPSGARRPFDVAYEKESGRVMLVYGNTETDGTKDLSYRIWDGVTWGEERYIDDVGHSGHIKVSYVELATKLVSGSNEIGLIYTDSTNSDAVAMIWNGTSWGDQQEITGSVSTVSRGVIAIAYEQQSGYLMAVAGQGSLIAWSRYTTQWSTPDTFDINPYATASMSWLVLKADPSSNRLMLLSLDRAYDACASDWTGSSWGATTRLDSRLETYSYRALDGDWEPTGSRFIAVAGDRNVDAISYKIWTPESGWDPSEPNVWTRYDGLTTDQRWVQVRHDPRGVGSAKLWIATLDDGYDLVLTKWNGSDMGDQIQVTSNVGTLSYESFEVEFQVTVSETIDQRLEIVGTFLIDTAAYPLDEVQTVEVQIKLRAGDGLERWFLKAYNWTSATYSDAGFNSTAGHAPTTGWDYYAVNLTDQWGSYVHENGTVRVEFVDEGADDTQTTIDIDFLAVRVVVQGASFRVKNTGASTIHVVSIWVTNSTVHQRYEADFFVNSGESALYARRDILLPEGGFVVKVVTERGNVAVFSVG